MGVLNLTHSSPMYTSNVYLVLGTWKAMEDVNTLVDVGRDPSILEKIKEVPTGVGKPKVGQVLLTHSHYDHVSLLYLICEAFNPVVYAFSPSLPDVDHLLEDGNTLRIGDRVFEVIHTPGHSGDSVCLYCGENGMLFAGDTPMDIRSVGGTYEEGFITALENLCRKDIRSIYLGHGAPILSDCNTLIRNTLRNVNESLRLWSGT